MKYHLAFVLLLAILLLPTAQAATTPVPVVWSVNVGADITQLRPNQEVSIFVQGVSNANFTLAIYQPDVDFFTNFSGKVPLSRIVEFKWIFDEGNYALLVVVNNQVLASQFVRVATDQYSSILSILTIDIAKLEYTFALLLYDFSTYRALLLALSVFLLAMALLKQRRKIFRVISPRDTFAEADAIQYLNENKEARK